MRQRSRRFTLHTGTVFVTWGAGEGVRARVRRRWRREGHAVPQVSNAAVSCCSAAAQDVIAAFWSRSRVPYRG